MSEGGGGHCRPVGVPLAHLCIKVREGLAAAMARHPRLQRIHQVVGGCGGLCQQVIITTRSCKHAFLPIEGACSEPK